MNLLVELLSGFCLLAGGFLAITGGVGLLRMPDFFARVHAAGVTETLATPLLLTGLMLQMEWSLDLVKVLMIMILILATNPIFPRDVVDARVSWGGLDGDKFHHVTAYETEHFCKPNPDFFRENLDLLQLEAERCLMVGNDTLHDLSASQVGMQTCLLTPWCIRRPKGRFRADWQGRHEDLLALIEA